jgi:hypothetical protein
MSFHTWSPVTPKDTSERRGFLDLSGDLTEYFHPSGLNNMLFSTSPTATSPSDDERTHLPPLPLKSKSKNDIFNSSTTPSPAPPPKLNIQIVSPTKPNKPNATIKPIKASPLTISKQKLNKFTPKILPVQSYLNLAETVPLEVSFDRKNRIGEGRGSQVYKGTLSAKNTMVVVKKILNNDEAITSAKAEVAVLHRVRQNGGHSNIMKLLGVQLGNNNCYELSTKSLDNVDSLPVSVSNTHIIQSLVLPMYSMGTLMEYIQNHNDTVGLTQWTKWAQQSANALSFLHSNHIIHHDIKPHNMFITSDLDIVIGDFGDSILLPETDEDPTLIDGLGRGTLPYSAPELLHFPFQPYSYPIDVYSLGVSLWVIGILGTDPFASIKNSVELTVLIRGGQFFNYHSNSAKGQTLKFLNGEPVPYSIVSLMEDMLDPDSLRRPSAKQLATRFDRFKGMGANHLLLDVSPNGR